jgi:hypothetical protein
MVISNQYHQLKNLNLHSHHFLVRRNQLIPYLDPHLQRHRRFLQIGHHIVKRHARFTQTELLRLCTRSGLGIADTVKSGVQLPAKLMVGCSSATL